MSMTILLDQDDVHLVPLAAAGAQSHHERARETGRPSSPSVPPIGSRWGISLTALPEQIPASTPKTYVPRPSSTAEAGCGTTPAKSYSIYDTGPPPPPPLHNALNTTYDTRWTFAGLSERHIIGGDGGGTRQRTGRMGPACCI